MAKINLSKAEKGMRLDGQLLVKRVSDRVAKTGSTYVSLTLSDGETDISANMFRTCAADLAAEGVVADSICDVAIEVGEFNGAQNYTMKGISRTEEEANLEEFIMLPPLNADTMLSEIYGALKSVSAGDSSVAVLAARLIKAHEEGYKTSSAAEGMHHNFLHGLLYHSYRMVKSSLALADIYGLDKELLVSAAAIHDIGKVKEYETSPVGTALMTPDGVMLGHAFIAMHWIANESESRGGYDSERVTLLMHCIAAHHGTLEWGAITTPAIPEAQALHFIDNIDAKMNMFEQTEPTIEAGTVMDHKAKGIDSRVYKPTYMKEAE